MSKHEDYQGLGENEFSLYTYQKEDGNLDYDKYVQVQSGLNKKKLHLNGPSDLVTQQLCSYIKQEFDICGLKPRVGLCHGTRRGHEQEYFSKYLDIPVMGTEISDTAEQFPNTIKWDFHDVHDAWIGNIDFIYSNSLDHSYDPIHCLKQWFKCLRVGGICVLAWESGDQVKEGMRGILDSATDVQGDPFRASIEGYTKMIKIAGNEGGLTGLKYILNTEFMGIRAQAGGTCWDMEGSEWGLFDYHFVIQKFSNTEFKDMPKKTHTK